MTTAPELVDDLGITYRQLDYWERQGFIRALPRTAQRSGHHREFTDTECRIARDIRDLLDAGFTLAAAVEVTRRLRESPFEHTFDLAPGITITIDRPL